MKINVPPSAQEHFWDAATERSVRFWPFRSKPPCKIGEELLFLFDGRPVDRAVVSGIEPPGIAWWESSEEFSNHWKVYWHQRTFQALEAPKGPRLFISLEPEVKRPSNPQRVIKVSEVREFVYCPRSWRLRLQGIKPPSEAVPPKKYRIDKGNRFHREHGQAVYRASQQPERRGWLTVMGMALMILGVLACLLS